MTSEPCITVTMRLVAAGHSLAEVEELHGSSVEEPYGFFSCFESKNPVRFFFSLRFGDPRDSDDSQHSPPAGLMACQEAYRLAGLILIGS